MRLRAPLFVPFVLVSLAVSLSLVACGDDDDAPANPPETTAGAGGSAAGAGGSDAGAGGSAAGAGGSDAGAGGSAAGAGGSAAGAAGAAGGEPGTIVEIAVGNPDFSTLVDLVTSAGLADALGGAGPYTVFAPTNDAFAAFLTDTGLTLEALKDPANKPILTDILTYHVSTQASAATPATKGIFSAELVGLPDVSSFLGATQKTAFLDVSLPASGRTGGAAFVGLAPPLPFFGPVVTADVAASNGVIHAISKVMVPPKYVSFEGTAITVKLADAKSTVVDLASFASTTGLGNGPEFKTLTALVVKCDLAATLAAATDVTVFAPTDAAFATAGITDSADCAAATPILQFHVLPAVAPASAAIAAAGSGAKLDTLLTGKQLGFKLGTDGALNVDDGSATLPKVVLKNIQTSNAVLHAIDKVLTPPS
jgi:transforming growth factor-beta-induced protein